MPKLNVLQLHERLKERLDKLESGEEIDARDVKALLNKEQLKKLDMALAEQKELRNKYRQPKTEKLKNEIGWKTIREVRIEVYRQAIEDLKVVLVSEVREIQRQREVKAARVFLDAYCKAGKEGKNAMSAGNIALARNGFRRRDSVRLSKRDIEIREMEERIKNGLKNEAGCEGIESKKEMKKG